MINKLLEDSVIENETQYLIAGAVFRELPLLKLTLTPEEIVLFESAEYNINNAYLELFAFVCEEAREKNMKSKDLALAIDLLTEARDVAMGRIMLQLLGGRY